MVLEEMEALEQALKDKVYQVIQKDLVVTVENLLQVLELVLAHLHQNQGQEVRKLQEEVVQVVDLEVEQELVEVKLSLQVQEDKAEEQLVEAKAEASVEVGEVLIQVNQEDGVIYGLK